MREGSLRVPCPFIRRPERRKKEVKWKVNFLLVSIINRGVVWLGVTRLLLEKSVWVTFFD